MKKVLFFGAMIVLMSGCYSLRTDPNQPLSEATFGEKFQRVVLFCHDCRVKPEDCKPICIRHKKAMENSKKDNEETWKWFQEIKPFHPLPVGLKGIDDINYVLAGITEQMITEVIQPYCLLDKEGHIEAYNEFVGMVKEFEKMGYKGNEAIEKAWNWSVENNGYYNTERLKAAMPFIEQMQGNEQLKRALIKYGPILAKIGLEWTKTAKEVKAALNTNEGKAQVTLAGVQFLVVVNQFRKAITFLSAYNKENNEADKLMYENISAFVSKEL